MIVPSLKSGNIEFQVYEYKGEYILKTINHPIFFLFGDHPLNERLKQIDESIR